MLTLPVHKKRLQMVRSNEVVLDFLRATAFLQLKFDVEILLDFISRSQVLESPVNWFWGFCFVMLPHH